VAAAFAVSVLGYGVQYSFGVFLKPLALDFQWSRAATAGAFAAFTIGRGVYGIVMGAMTDRYGPRVVVGAGALLMGMGMMLTAAISELWHLYLIYAFLIGGGVAAVYVPLTATLSRWFHTRLGLALGFLNAGAGVGMVAMSPLVGVLTSFYGVRTGYLAIGGAVLILALLCAQVLRKEPAAMGLQPYGYPAALERGSGQAKPSPGQNEELPGLTFKQALGTRSFQALAVIAFMFDVCLFTVLINIVAHATDLGISPLAAPTILSVVGGFFIVGVLVVGNASDRLGHTKLLAFCILLQAASVLWLTSLKSFGLFCLFGALLGFCYGGIRVTLAGVSAHFFGTRCLGPIFGTIIASALVGAAVGSVLGNVVYELTRPHSYTLAFWMVGGALLASSVLFLALRKPGAA